MPEEWLRRYYETVDNEYVLKIIRHYGNLVDRFLKLCVTDGEVRVEIWFETVNSLRRSARHPELNWDLKRGTVTGFLFSTALHLAFRWLVWFEFPGR
jgi:hypothetical protein